MTNEYDVVVLGGGPGGYVAAIRAAQLGARVALVEKDRVGGVCLNVGCIPTKALVATAEALQVGREGRKLGFGGTLELDFTAALRHKDAAVTEVVGGVERLLEERGVRIVRGLGRLVEENTISVETASDEIRFSATRGLIVAPGSVSAPPPFPVVDHPWVVDSTGALSFPHVPERLVIVGGGAIGAEFASIFSAFGSKVTVLEYLDTLLPGLDTDLGRRLELAFSRSGIDVRTRSQVEAVEADGALLVKAAGPHGEFAIMADAVLLATGRRPATGGIGLEDAGLRIESGVMQVNGHLQTNLPGVYAVGDATGGPMFAHRAMAQGRIAAENSLGGNRVMDDGSVPIAVFTTPEVGSVGLTLDQAEDRGISADEASFPFASNGRALATGEVFGEVKVVCERKSGKVLGVHIIGPRAIDLIAEAALAVRLGLDVSSIADTAHPHPGFGEALMEAALGCRGSMIHHIYR